MSLQYYYNAQMCPNGHHIGMGPYECDYCRADMKRRQVAQEQLFSSQELRNNVNASFQKSPSENYHDNFSNGKEFKGETIEGEYEIVENDRLMESIKND